MNNTWFSKEEYVSRVSKAQETLALRNLESLLVFEPESVTYLTGFYTEGYSSFQFAIIPAKGEPLIFCRDMEKYYLDQTAVFSQHCFWRDSDDKYKLAIQTIQSASSHNAKIGIEMSSWQFPASLYLKIKNALPKVEFIDASDIIANLRLIKSTAEINYQKKAAKAAEAGMEAGWKASLVGKTERDVAAAVCSAMILAGSDRAGPGVLSSGERALHLHGSYTDRKLQKGDTVQLECCPAVNGYHARFMRTIKVEQATDEDHGLIEKIIQIQDKALSNVGPGVSAELPDRIYREEVIHHGLAEQYTNKTFYSIGLLLSPNSGEALEAFPGCNWVFKPGMTLHTYILMRGFGFSESIVITDGGYERLTNFARKLCISRH